MLGKHGTRSLRLAARAESWGRAEAMPGPPAAGLKRGEQAPPEPPRTPSFYEDSLRHATILRSSRSARDHAARDPGAGVAGRVALAIVGVGVQSLACLLTGNPLPAILAHVAMHLTAVLHGMESVVQLPPHY